MYALARNLRPAPICSWTLSFLFSAYLLFSLVYLRLVLMLIAFGSCFGFSAQLHCVLLYAFVFCSWRLHGVIMLYASCS